MRGRAAHEGRMQQARQLQIVHEPAGAAQQSAILEAQHRAAAEAARFSAHRGCESPACGPRTDRNTTPAAAKVKSGLHAARERGVVALCRPPILLDSSVATPPFT